jgi:copper chaperone CopZ
VFSVAVSALVAGLSYDALVVLIGHSGFSVATHQHEHEMGGASGMFTMLLLAVIVYSVLEARILGLLKGMRPAAPPIDTPHVTLSVKGMTCSHCAARVRRELEQTAGAGNVDVDLAGGQATITGSGLDGEALRKAVAGLGYNVCVLD